jgi:3' terminal RNA ribose 2'-O-methyltransferase Hen1
LRLTGELRLADALNHLYVLLPVLDDAKHYWVSEDEVDKLLRAGAGWLATHPAKELITRRYLAGRRSLALSALERLQVIDDAAEPEAAELDVAGLDIAEGSAAAKASMTSEAAGLDLRSGDVAVPGGDAVARVEAAEGRKPLVKLRKEAVLAALAESGAARVLDLGCGPGALLLELLAERRYTEIVGADVSSVSLSIAERRLKLDRMPDRQRERITLIQSALTYHDDRLIGYDAAVLMEVIEHVDEVRLPALERAVFGHAAPAHRARDDAERGVQRPLRGARRPPARRSPLRVDPCRVRRLVRPGRRPARLPRRDPSGRRAGRNRRRPDPARDLHQDRHR